MILFIVLHLFIYPASNAYNSYMDKDEGSIGGLERPPAVTIQLYYASIFFDISGLLIAFGVSWKLVLLLLPYIAVSKAYSWHKIRLKKFAFVSWLVVMIFQGGYTFMLVHMCITNNFSENWFIIKNLAGCGIASLQVGGFYPLTQIYQHKEDNNRGDYTLSSKLGTTGTFVFSGSFFMASALAFFYYFKAYDSVFHFFLYLLFLAPLIFFFCMWFYRVLKNPLQASYKNSLRMNQLAAICMIAFFLVLLAL